MTILLPPTSCLPPICKIQHHSAEDLSKALGYLRLIYNPEVRGIRRLDHKKGTSSITGINALRSDAFERSYAVRWLTALVSKAYRLPECPDDADFADREALVQEAASLLATCAGTASAGTVTRVFRFQHTLSPIEVQLTDVSLENQDYASVGAQTWGSACLLAEMLVEAPETFGLVGCEHGLRALELGSGTGLVSMTLAKILEVSASEASTVIATDFHPSVLANLRSNCDTNFSLPTPVSISTHFLDWSQFPLLKSAPPFDEQFDLILGADIIYEAEHAHWIKGCVEKLLREPDSTGSNVSPARFHLVIPLRPTHALESSIIERIFPSVDSEALHTCECSPPALAVLSKDVIVCEAHGDVRSRNGIGNEVEYVHYVIGWCS